MVSGQHDRQNSLPDVLCPGEEGDSWEKHWSKHGEQIIWASWIDKYSDYIDPAFLDEECSTGKTIHEGVKDVFTFEEGEDVNRTCTEIIVSNCSPGSINSHQQPKDEDGWNPLSPNSETWNTYRHPNSNLSSDFFENLLSPRCESVTSSIPLTIGTTDSMTNVTR